MTNEELRAKWDRNDLTSEERIEALVRVFGMPRDRAIGLVQQTWKEAIPGLYEQRDEQEVS